MIIYTKHLEHLYYRISLAVQWLRLRASTAGGSGSIPGQGPKVPHAKGQSQKKKKNPTAVITAFLIPEPASERSSKA